MTKFMIIALCGASVAGCSMTLPVRGQLQDGSETFTGAGYLDGGGVITIVSSKSVTCLGDFVNVSGRDGEGVFQCDDGRSGPFRFVSTGTRGSGTGTLGGRQFTFTFRKTYR